MRITTLIIPLLLLCATGCAQKGQHNFHLPGKIPIEGKRWYQLTNATSDLDVLFDNDQFQKPNTGYHKLLEHYDSWYPLKEGEQMTIDSIMMYCWRCIDPAHPVTVYAVMKDWQRVPIAVFKGARASAWEGPDPDRTGTFALPRPVSGMRYLVINSWGEFPAEIEFYGKYIPPSGTHEHIANVHPRLGNYFGVNAFEWNVEDEHNPAPLPALTSAVAGFSGLRHYLDWGKLEHRQGGYTFNPAYDGSWDYDAMYQWCKDNNVEVLTCLKTIPKWLEETYPEGQRNYENVPAHYGSNLDDPASYREQAMAAFQFASRYGHNTSVRGLVKIDAHMRWPGDRPNVPKVGLGLVTYIECDNERDKWWKGRAAYQTAREYAANMSAFYDGDKGRLGPGVGVKTADPEMKVVMGGLASADPRYVMAMIDWSREHRGYKKDGTIDVPWDIINYHYYSNDGTAAKDATKGVAPEVSNATDIARAFVHLANHYLQGMPVWVTEAGYDINPQSTQRAVAAGNNDVLTRQADWILRTSLLYARCGIDRVFFYELYDDDPKSTVKYGTSGLVNTDHTNRPAADYMKQVRSMFGTFIYSSTLSSAPFVDKYVNGDKEMYVVMPGISTGNSFWLDFGSANTAYIYMPQRGNNMKVSTVGTRRGKVEIKAGETPLFVTGYRIGIK